MLAQARLSRLNVNQSDCEFQMIQHVNSFGVFRMFMFRGEESRKKFIGIFFFFLVFRSHFLTIARYYFGFFWILLGRHVKLMCSMRLYGVMALFIFLGFLETVWNSFRFLLHAESLFRNLRIVLFWKNIGEGFSGILRRSSNNSQRLPIYFFFWGSCGLSV